MKPSDEALNGQIDAIWIQFRADIGQAFNAAYAVEEPAGVTPDWQAMCQHWGVAHISDDERQQVRAAQKPLRGASAIEFLGVVKAIVKTHRIATKKLDSWDAHSTIEAKHTRLRSLLDRTDNELITAYKTAVLPKPGGMFAHAMAGAGAGPKPAQTGPTTSTLSCRGCGAPRLSTTDLICAYCDQQLV